MHGHHVVAIAHIKIERHGLLLAEISSSKAKHLQDLLGLSDEELIRTLDASALELLSGELEHRPQLPILLDLLADAEERTSPATLRRWLRVQGSYGRPVDLLTSRDFAGFEDALADLARRGFVLRSGHGPRA